MSGHEGRDAELEQEWSSGADDIEIQTVLAGSSRASELRTPQLTHWCSEAVDLVARTLQHGLQEAFGSSSGVDEREGAHMARGAEQISAVMHQQEELLVQIELLEQRSAQVVEQTRAWFG
jgi:hypothetical protein